MDEIGASGGIELECRVDAAAREVDAIEDLWAILGEDGGGIAIELEGQTAVVGCADGEPEARMDLIEYATTQGVALVL